MVGDYISVKLVQGGDVGIKDMGIGIQRLTVVDDGGKCVSLYVDPDSAIIIARALGHDAPRLSAAEREVINEAISVSLATAGGHPGRSAHRAHILQALLDRTGEAGTRVRSDLGEAVLAAIEATHVIVERGRWDRVRECGELAHEWLNAPEDSSIGRRAEDDLTHAIDALQPGDLDS